MRQEKNNSQGFTLVAALLILVLLSGVAVGLLFIVTNESRIGGNDLEANMAYYGAESGMEKLTADLSSLYTQYMIPSNAQIQNLVNFPPTSAMVSGSRATSEPGASPRGSPRSPSTRGSEAGNARPARKATAETISSGTSALRKRATSSRFSRRPRARSSRRPRAAKSAKRVIYLVF